MGVNPNVTELAEPLALQVSASSAKPPLKYIYEWWPLWDRGILSRNIDGSGTVSIGDRCSRVRGRIRGTVLTASSDDAGPVWRANAIDSAAGLEFTGGPEGLVGPMLTTFQESLTLILIGRFTSLDLTFRGIVSGGPDMESHPYETGNGFLIDTGGDGATIEWMRQTNAPGGFADAAHIKRAVALDPICVVCTLDSSLRMPFLIPGWHDGPGVAKMFINGGFPDCDVSGYRDQNPVQINYFSIGGRTDSRFGPAMLITDVILCSAEEAASTLDRFRILYMRDRYPSI